MINCSYFSQRRTPLYHPYSVSRRSLISPARNKHKSVCAAARAFWDLQTRSRPAAERSADKWSRSGFVVFRDYKSRRVIVRRLHCTIKGLIRGVGGGVLSVSNGARLPVDTYRAAAPVSRKKVPLSPLLRRCYQLGLRVWLPPTSSPAPRCLLRTEGREFPGGDATVGSRNANYCAGETYANRISLNQERPMHAFACRAVFTMRDAVSVR